MNELNGGNMIGGNTNEGNFILQVSNAVGKLRSAVGDGATYAIIALLQKLDEWYRVGKYHMAAVHEDIQPKILTDAAYWYWYMHQQRLPVTNSLSKKNIRVSLREDTEYLLSLLHTTPLVSELLVDYTQDTAEPIGYVVSVPLLYTKKDSGWRRRRWFRYNIPHIMLLTSFGEYRINDMRFILGMPTDAPDDAVMELLLLYTKEVTRLDREWLEAVFGSVWGRWFSNIANHTHTQD